MMRKFWGLCVLISLLSACASVPVRPACKAAFVRPSFFEHGEKLAAFRVSATAKEYGLEGILQIKKLEADKYEITIFSTVGAYRLLQATLSHQGTEYTFLAPGVDHTAVQIRVERFLNLLLMPSLSAGVCKVKKDNVRVSYKHPIKIYEYPAGQIYPQTLTGPKAFGKLYMTFLDYQLYEGQQLPHTLHYQDGRIKITLTLLRLKK